MDEKIFQNSFKLGKRIVTVEVWSAMMTGTTVREEDQIKEGKDRNLELQ